MCIRDSARRAGFDTIQYTHRSELWYRYEITDLRIRNPPDACGYTQAMRSGYGGNDPCECDASQRMLQCSYRPRSDCSAKRERAD